MSLRDGEKVAVGDRDVSIDEPLASGTAEDILSMQDVDPALNAKMHLVNNVRITPCAEFLNLRKPYRIN